MPPALSTCPDSRGYHHGPDSGLTGLTGDAGYLFRVSFSFVATGLQASRDIGGFEDVEGPVSDGGHVGGAISGAGPGLVLAEGDVGHPVETVPDHPMAADGPGARLRCHRPGRDTWAIPPDCMVVLVTESSENFFPDSFLRRVSQKIHGQFDAAGFMACPPRPKRGNALNGLMP